MIIVHEGTDGIVIYTQCKGQILWLFIWYWSK